MTENYTFGLRIHNESSSTPGMKTGHVGFYLEDPQGQRRHFDHGMVGSYVSKETMPKALETTTSLLPVAGVTLYSLFGFAVGLGISPSLPLLSMVGAYMGAAYGGGLGLGVGMTTERNQPSSDPHQEIRIDISRAQYDGVLDYVENHKFSLYSAGIKNCITYTETMMRECGIETGGVLSGTLTLPTRFAKKIESIHSKNEICPQ